MIAKVFDELKLTGRLPSPPGVGMAILRLSQGEDYSILDVARTIQSDPALTGRVLKLTNSSRNASVYPITTVDEAVSRLGIRTLRAVALGFSLVSAYREGTCQAFDFCRFWSESLARAIAAQTVSEELDLAVPAEAYSCGLLGQIGRLAFACVHPDVYSKIVTNTQGASATELAAAEIQSFEIDHSEIGEAMLGDWGLPLDHCRAVGLFERHDADLGRESKTTTMLARVLRIADPIAVTCIASSEVRAGEIERLSLSRQESGLDEDEFNALCDRVVAQWSSWGSILDLPTYSVPPFASLRRQSSGESRNATAEVSAVEPAPAVAAERLLRILAVDDDDVSLRLLAHHLEGAGHEVILARNGKEALGIALEVAPDVIVSDWKMPEMNGLELVRALRNCSKGQQIYLILLTGTGVDDDDSTVDAFAAGIDDFVTKPFSPPVLLARVHAGSRVVQMQRQIAIDKKRMQEQLGELAVLNRKLQQTSLTDTLTGLPNRRYAIDRLQSQWAESRRYGESCAAIMIDVDHFKSVNDGYGHDVGDEVLKETARIFRTHVREDETVCRIGGEEFLVICRQADVAAAKICAERIRQAVADNKVEYMEFNRAVTVSLGVAVIDATMDSFEDLLKAADEAVYAAKNAGRNQVHVAGAEIVI